MGGRGIFQLVIFIFVFCLPNAEGAKRRYFKFGGNWKSWRDQYGDESWSKGRNMFGRRSLPDRFTVQSETREVVENTQVNLTCAVDRHRYPSVRWSRYGQPLPISVQEKDDKILFPSVQLGDAGTYVCTASNDWDTKEIHIKMTVQPSDRFREQVGAVSHCRYDQATCRSGECINRSDLCDGEQDCRDGSDEQHCGQALSSTGQCEPNEHRCSNGKCIQRMWFCDGDDDCGDRSDESNCGQRQPGEQCAPYEFKCHSQSQCVPLAYQCDKNNDCFDGSDEVGCAGPTVVEPPQRDLSVKCGETIVLNCRTIGVPVPYVNWRLNWGPVCAPPRCTQTSSNGVGTLTIRNAQDCRMELFWDGKQKVLFRDSDQGAYTCEAVNVINRVLATPDAIVRVDCRPRPSRNCDPRGTLPDDGSGRCICKPNVSGPRCDQCAPGSFYLYENNPQGCIKCFCSGVTGDCQSSSWYRTQERLVFTLDDQDVSFADRDKSAPIVDFDHGRYRGYITHNGKHIGNLYWHMPRRLLGNKLTAYGGKLKFSFQFSGSGSPSRNPLVLLKGNEITAVYRGQPSYDPEKTHDIVVDLYENVWFREDGQPMTREHFLMALANLDTFLIRATHVDQHSSSSLGEISLDIAAAINTQQERAWVVEECRCPEGYQGLSCEECAPGYERSGGGLYLGTCVKRAPLRVRVEPKHQEEDEGTTVTYRAVIDGVPGGGAGGGYVYTWTRVGYPQLPPNAVVDRETGTLTISDLKIEDRGEYRVTVTGPGGAGAGSDDGDLKVRRVGTCPYVWIEPLTSWRGQPGEKIEFNCKAIGEPTPRLFWARVDGRPLDSNARDRGDGTLVIDNVQPNNYGQYVCSGENRAGKNSANASVAEGGAAERSITVRIEPSNTVPSKRYDLVQITCVATGTPTPNITWTREDGSPLHTNAQDQGNGVLRFNGIDKINAGLYRCTARNQYTQASDIANVLQPTDIRSAPPSVIVSPRELEARIGDEVSLECTAIVDSRDPAPRLTWTRQGGKELNADIEDSGQGKLRISSFKENHAGVYECTALGVYSKAVGIATLRVKAPSGHPPPVPEVTPKIQTVFEGDQVEFKCRAEGWPVPVLTWGFGSANGTLIGSMRQDGDTLIIDGAQLKVHDGQYFCTATNQYGSNSASGTLFIEKAQTAPKVQITPQKHWTGKTGQNFYFDCTAKGYPQPKVWWSREGGGDLDSNVKADSEGHLTVSNAKFANSGKYICTASNSVGEDSDTVTVEVESEVSAKILFDGKEAGEVINVEENTPFKLECIGVGDPEPKVAWSVDMGPSRGDVPKGYKPVEIYNQFVIHDSFSRANEGVYKCSASSDFGEAEDSVKVVVVPRAKRHVVILEGSERVVAAGSRVVLRCLLSDTKTKYTLRWSRKSPTELPLPPQSQQLQDGVLVIPTISAGDGGAYECQAWDSDSDEVVGSDEAKVTVNGEHDLVTVVNVEGGPVKYVTAGDALELQCTAPVSASGVRSELQWFLVHQGSFRPVPKGQITNGVLRITNVSVAESGVYSCVRYLDGQRDGSYHVAVVVSNTETTAKQTKAELNSPLELRCPVFHVPGATYLWKTVTGTGLPSGVQADQKVLRIPQYEATLAGTYECESSLNGQHAKGFVQVVSSGVDKLAKIFRPMFPIMKGTAATSSPTTDALTQSTKKPYLELTMDVMPDFAFPGKDVTLRCSVDDEPNIQIRWERIGRPLPRTAYITGQQLKLRKLQVGDVGRYRCSATTGVGLIFVETVLKIGEKNSGNIIRRYYDV